MSQNSMTSGWYYAKAGTATGHEIGPLSWDELYRLAEAGTVEPSDIVWNPRLPRGVTAGMIPELFPGRQISQAPVIQTPSQPLPPEPEPMSPKMRPEPSEPTEQPIAPISAEEPPGPVMDNTEIAATTPDDSAEEIEGESTSEESTKRSEQTHSKKVKGTKSATQNNRLPVLVLILVVVIAAAGLVAYFLYFRDTSDQTSGQERMLPTPTIALAADSLLTTRAFFEV